MSRVALTLLAAILLIATTTGQVHAEAKPLIEAPAPSKNYWTLALLGGAASPLADYADNRKRGLAAQTTIAFTGASGFGGALIAAYSPLPAKVNTQEIRRDNHLLVAALTPQFTLGHGTLRFVLGGGGGIIYERSRIKTIVDVEPISTTRTVAAGAALGEAEIRLHIFATGGLVIGGSYLHGFGKSNAQLATARAGFLLAF